MLPVGLSNINEIHKVFVLLEGYTGFLQFVRVALETLPFNKKIFSGLLGLDDL